MMKNGLKIIVGMLLALAMCELGLRLYFTEYEAIGSYTGRQTNVPDPRLGFRFTPNMSMPCGREGKIPEVTLVSNPYGFRDEKDYRNASGSPVIGVYGASYMFGIGIDRNEDMFYSQLKSRLIGDYSWPGSLEVYNLSSLGYMANQIVELVDMTVDDLRPDMVLVVTRPISSFFKPESVELIDGINFHADRFAAGSFIDFLRTGSYIYMRSAKSPMLKNPVKKYLPFNKIDPDQKAAQLRQCNTRQVELLGQLRDRLALRNIAMGVVLVNERNEELMFLCRQAQLPHIYVSLDSDCFFSGDNHWNISGHNRAAVLVAEFTDKLAKDPKISFLHDIKGASE